MFGLNFILMLLMFGGEGGVINTMLTLHYTTLIAPPQMQLQLRYTNYTTSPLQLNYTTTTTTAALHHTTSSTCG